LRDGDLTPWGERAWIGVLQVVPLRAYTGLIRMLAGIPLPRRLRRPVFGRLAWRLGIDMSEAEHVVTEYRSFGDLFVRRLRDDQRPVDDDAASVVSPVDGSLSACGEAVDGEMIQAKGIDYRLEELLENDDLADQLRGGTYLTLYLQPKDYHRIHCPVTAEVRSIRQIKGTLFPVKPYMVRNLRGLFTRNERVVFELDSEVGKMAMICVAAAGVGNISTVYDNGRRRPPYRSLASKVRKGEEVAAFNLGSTVILVFAPDRVEMEELSPGQPVRMGQRLARTSGKPVRALALGR
jgi:phosphatidylserine decarboxylase